MHLSRKPHHCIILFTESQRSISKSKKLFRSCLIENKIRMVRMYCCAEVLDYIFISLVAILHSRVFGEVAAGVFSVGLRSSSTSVNSSCAHLDHVCRSIFSSGYFVCFSDGCFAITILAEVLPLSSLLWWMLGTDWNVLDGCFVVVVLPCMVTLHPFYRFRCFGRFSQVCQVGWFSFLSCCFSALGLGLFPPS